MNKIYPSYIWYSICYNWVMFAVDSFGFTWSWAIKLKCEISAICKEKTCLLWVDSFGFTLVLSHQNLLRKLVIDLECIVFKDCFPFLLEMHTLTSNFSTLLYTAFSALGRFFRGWKLFSNASLCACLLFEWVFGLLSLFLQYLMS